MTKKRFEDRLDPADVALLKMAVDQIEAAPVRFDINRCCSTERFDCHTTLCIGGHMAILAHPEYIRNWIADDVCRWMSEIEDKNSAWANLFYDLSFGMEDITADNIRARVAYWLQTGK